MSRRIHVPSYREHKQSGQAIVTLTDGAGGRRDVLLGKHGTAASLAEYHRVVTEWEAAGRSVPTAPAAADITIAELLARFLEHAKQHYRYADGTPTNELSDCRLSFRPRNYLYRDTLAKDFGPLKLTAVQPDGRGAQPP